MKTSSRSVQFSYGTVKNAELLVPVGPYSINDIANLIRKSYLNWMFGTHNAIMSDECVTSCIGKSNFYAGALGGYETRLDDFQFKTLKSCMDNDEMTVAVDVAMFRNPNLSRREAYRIAAKNEALSEDTRKFLNEAANTEALWQA